MATNQTQNQPPNPGRAKAIRANSRVFAKAYGIGGLKRPGRKVKWTGGNKNQPK
jgi:hypothetical protein